MLVRVVARVDASDDKITARARSRHGKLGGRWVLCLDAHGSLGAVGLAESKDVVHGGADAVLALRSIGLHQRRPGGLKGPKLEYWKVGGEQNRTLYWKP